MTKLFIIRNQNGQYLSKQQEWLDGGDRNSLYRTVHHDEAINTVFEVSSRDIYLRAETLTCDADARGNPLLDEGAVPARDADATVTAVETTDLEADIAAAIDTDVPTSDDSDSSDNELAELDQDEATA